MKNVLIVCHDFTISGANMALLDVLSNNTNKEYNYYVLLPRKSDILQKKITELGCNVIIGNYIVTTKHLYKDRLKEKIKQLIKYIIFKFINPIQINRIVKKLNNINIDLIHSNSFAVTIGAEIAKKMNIPHIWHIREFMEEDHEIEHYNKEKLKGLVEYSNAIFISNAIKNKYMEKYKFKSLTILYDNLKYDSTYKKEREFLQNNQCNLIIVGNLTENKGQLIAIKALEYINKKEISNNYKFILYICGQGPNEIKLKEYIKNRNIKNIIFKGYVEKMQKIRKNIDIALICSKKEAFGRVTVEAMYYENFAIGSNSGCTKEILDEKYSDLYEEDNYIDLANKIIDAVNNKEETIKKINNAKKIALQRYNRNILKDIEILYKNVLESEKDNEGNRI